MITTRLKQYAHRTGIKAIRIWGTNGTVTPIFATDCFFILLDEESGGVWYWLNPAKFTIPIISSPIYVAQPLLIIFNEDKEDNNASEKTIAR